MMLWLLLFEKLPVSLLSIFPFSLKNHFKTKTNPFSPSLFTFSQLSYSNCKMPVQVHLKKINQDHTDVVISSGGYFDDIVEFPWENHQTSLKSDQLKAATGVVIQWQSCVPYMQSDFSSSGCWTAAHLFQDSRFFFDIHKPFGYFPKILLLNENSHSQNPIFTSSLFLRVVAGTNH